MNNIEIRKTLKAVHMKQWELADAMGISEYTLCKKLRHELPNDQKKEILGLIQNYQKGGEGNV